MPKSAADWLIMANRYREAERLFYECRQRDAALRERELRLIADSKRRIEESRELLAKIDAMLAARPTARIEVSSVPANTLCNAMERVFDRWADKQASPVPRSMSMH